MIRKFTLKGVIATIGSMLLMAIMAVLLLAFWMGIGLLVYCMVT